MQFLHKFLLETGRYGYFLWRNKHFVDMYQRFHGLVLKDNAGIISAVACLHGQNKKHFVPWWERKPIEETTEPRSGWVLRENEVFARGTFDIAVLVCQTGTSRSGQQTRRCWHTRICHGWRKYRSKDKLASTCGCLFRNTLVRESRSCTKMHSIVNNFPNNILDALHGGRTETTMMWNKVKPFLNSKI
jgi:hypothetical protein